MIKGIIAFILVMVLVYASLDYFDKKDNDGKMELVRKISYSAVISAVAVSILVAIVLLF